MAKGGWGGNQGRRLFQNGQGEETHLKKQRDPSFSTSQVQTLPPGCVQTHLPTPPHTGAHTHTGACTPRKGHTQVPTGRGVPTPTGPVTPSCSSRSASSPLCRQHFFPPHPPLSPHQGQGPLQLGPESHWSRAPMSPAGGLTTLLGLLSTQYRQTFSLQKNTNE